MNTHHLEETSDGMQALAEETEYANSEENLSYMEERFGTFNISGNDQNPTTSSSARDTIWCVAT